MTVLMEVVSAICHLEDLLVMFAPRMLLVQPVLIIANGVPHVAGRDVVVVMGHAFAMKEPLEMRVLSALTAHFLVTARQVVTGKTLATATAVANQMARASVSKPSWEIRVILVYLEDSGIRAVLLVLTQTAVVMGAVDRRACVNAMMVLPVCLVMLVRPVMISMRVRVTKVVLLKRLVAALVAAKMVGLANVSQVSIAASCPRISQN